MQPGAQRHLSNLHSNLHSNSSSLPAWRLQLAGLEFVEAQRLLRGAAALMGFMHGPGARAEVVLNPPPGARLPKRCTLVVCAQDPSFQLDAPSFQLDTPAVRPTDPAVAAAGGSSSSAEPPRQSSSHGASTSGRHDGAAQQEKPRCVPTCTYWLSRPCVRDGA
jgi:hypothetical protein